MKEELPPFRAEIVPQGRTVAQASRSEGMLWRAGWSCSAGYFQAQLGATRA